MAALTWLFALFCHQLPERSPQLAGIVFPVCARCAGLYFGILASYAYVSITGGRARRLPDVGVVAGSTALMVPLMVDGWGNALQLWSSPDWLRAVTGIGFGAVLPPLLVPLASLSPAAHVRSLPPTLQRPAELLVPTLMGSAMVGLLLVPPSLLVFQILGFAAAGGLVMLLLDLGRVMRVGSTCVPAAGTRGGHG